MGSLKGTAEKAIGKAKELVAEILGDGKLREQSKLDQRRRGEGTIRRPQSTGKPGSAYLNIAAVRQR